MNNPITSQTLSTDHKYSCIKAFNSWIHTCLALFSICNFECIQIVLKVALYEKHLSGNGAICEL